MRGRVRLLSAQLILLKILNLEVNLLYFSVLNMALDDINDNKSGLLTNYKLTAKIMDGECKPSTVMKKFIDIIMNDKVMRDFIGILGENDFALCSVFFYLSTI